MAAASRLIDDLVRTASSAAGTVFGLRDEVEAQMRERFERILARADIVGRDEFEAVKEVAATARSEQEKLTERVAALESRLAALEKPAGGRTSAGAAAKSANARSGAKSATKTKKADGQEPRTAARKSTAKGRRTEATRRKSAP
ncbi:MAG: accessory factor UbiK family protein [Azospirillaceae bacterium]